MKPILIVAALAAGLVAGAGCKKSSEKLTEKLIEKSIESDGGGKANVNIEDGRVTIKSKDGTMEMASGEGATLPADFPKDVFVAKNAKVVMSMKSTDGMQVVLESKEAMDKLTGTYATEMKSLGWTEESSVNMPEMAMRTYTKDERQTSVIISKADSGAQVQLVVGKK